MKAPAFLNRSTPSNAAVTVFPVPLETTTHTMFGLRDGPRALIEASREMEDFEPDLGIGLRDFTLTTVPAPALTGLRNEAALEVIESQTRDILRAGSWPLLLGGERTLSLGALRALKSQKEEFGVLALSAEAAFRSDFEGTRFSRRCSARRMFEEQVPLALAGLRSFSIEESEDLLHHGVPLVRPGALRRAGPEVLTGFLPKRIYLALDLGVLDPSIMPGTGSCEPAGLGWTELCEFLDQVFERFTVVGADLTELRPLANDARSEALAARLARRLIALHVRAA